MTVRCHVISSQFSFTLPRREVVLLKALGISPKCPAFVPRLSRGEVRSQREGRLVFLVFGALEVLP